MKNPHAGSGRRVTICTQRCVKPCGWPRGYPAAKASGPIAMDLGLHAVGHNDAH
jgi:hypothetical protein